MQKNIFSTKILVRAAFFTALSIVLTRMFSIMVTQALRIGFGSLPLIMSGLTCGPVIGAIVGALSDLIGVMINAQGTPHWGFTFSAMLEGIIPGIISVYFIKDDKKRLLAGIIISVVLVYSISHICLNTLWLSQLLGKSVIVMLPLRAVKACIEGVLATFILYVIMRMPVFKNNF